MDGDAFMIGDYRYKNETGASIGAAYVFVRSSSSSSSSKNTVDSGRATTDWILQARLTASDGAAPDFSRF